MEEETKKIIQSLLIVITCIALLFILVITVLLFNLKAITTTNEPEAIQSYQAEVNVAKNTFKTASTDYINPYGKEIYKLAADTYNIDWELLKAITIHETGHFTSEAYLNYNNPCGYVYWNNNLNKILFKSFNNIEDGVMYCTNNLRHGYDYNQHLENKEVTL